MGKVDQQSYKLKDGRTVTIRTAHENDAEAYLILGKSVMSEEMYTLTQADELTFTIEQEKNYNRNIYLMHVN